MVTKTNKNKANEKFISMIKKIQSGDVKVRNEGYEEIFSQSLFYNKIVNKTFYHFWQYGLSEDERQCFDKEDILQQIKLNIMEGLQKINTDEIEKLYKEAVEKEEDYYFIQKLLVKYLSTYASSVAGYVDTISRYGFTSRYYGRILNKARREDYDVSNDIEGIMKHAKCSEKTAKNIFFLYQTQFPSFEKMYNSKEIQNLCISNKSDYTISLLNEFLKILSEKELYYLEYAFSMKGCYNLKTIKENFLNQLKHDNMEEEFFFLTEEDLKENPTYAEWAVNKSLPPERKINDIHTSIRKKAKRFFDFKRYRETGVLEKR